MNTPVPDCVAKMNDSAVRFGQLTVRGFRRLQDVKLSLRPLSVMIGANGTGKTSILDVLSLLAYSAQGRLSSSLSELSGLANVLTYDRVEDLELGITMEVRAHEPLEYSLGDVYTGTNDFIDAADAKRKMREWVGHNPKFHPHAAQHDFEAWLLPFWSDIQKLAGHTKSAPLGPPESVNHKRPPSHHVREIFRIGTCRNHYSKPRDAGRILLGNDLSIAANACPELKAFLNTILTLCDAPCI